MRVHQLHVTLLPANAGFIFFCSFFKITMENLYDTPAIDLLDYGQDDGMGSCAYYWQVEDDTYDNDGVPTPAYFA